jgi:hypothetical protein
VPGRECGRRFSLGEKKTFILVPWRSGAEVINDCMDNIYSFELVDGVLEVVDDRRSCFRRNSRTIYLHRFN